MTQRFFVDPTAIDQGTVTMTGPQARQMLTVLRMRVGDRYSVLDNTGYEYEVDLSELTQGTARGTVRSRKLSTGEPRTKITIYQAMLKADRFEFVLQKGTEIGAVAFVPMICDRCSVGNLGDGRVAKIDRWERIIAEAAEQSGRGRLPNLQPAILYRQAVESIRGVALIPYELEHSVHLRDVLRPLISSQNESSAAGKARPFAISIFTGPEGGFTEAEIDLAKSYGVVPVTLGPRILRAETAAQATAAAILYESGDFG